MDIVLLSLLLIVGVVLVVAEILYLPGLTLAGFFGLLCLAGGVLMVYLSFGTWVGHTVLVGVILLIVIMFLLFLRNKTYKRITHSLTLKDVVEGVDSSIHKGDTGRTLGKLSPEGKILVNDKIVQAESEMGFIAPDKEVIIQRIMSNKVIVKLKTELDGR